MWEIRGDRLTLRRPIRLPESSRRFRWFATCAALLLAVSCTTKALPEEKVVTLQPGDATTSAPEAPTRVPAAACTVTLTGPDTLKIGDATVSLTMGLTLDVEAEEFEVFPSLAVWPYSPNSGDEVLFAVFADPLRWLGEPRDGRLWKTRCTDPKPELMLQQEGSDFAFAVPTEDHKGLYYTGPDGAALLDLSTLESRPVTRAPILEPANCWGGEGQPADDFVVGLVHEGRELVIHRGGPCGYESDWTGVELRVQVDPFPETPLSDVGPGLRAVHGLAVVAAGVGVAFGLSAQSKHNSVVNRLDPNDPTVGLGLVTQADLDDIHNTAIRADIFFGVAGLFAVTSLTLAFLTDWGGTEDASAPTQARVRLFPVASPQAAGLTLMGSF